MTIHVRPARLTDAPALSDLAAATFRDAFGSENTPEDVDLHVATTYSPARQAAEIADPDSTILLVEATGPDGAPELAGYAYLAVGPAPGAVRGPSPMELRRLYVARAWHGRGVAQALMDASLRACRARGAETLWLGVWERNPRAIAFYGKYGFQRVGEHTFMLGNDPQTDWLMARPTGSAPR